MLYSDRGDSNRRRSNAIKLKRMLRYSNSLEEIIKAILKIGENDKTYNVIAHDKITNIVRIQYRKKLHLQNIYIVPIIIDDDNTDLTIEVISDKNSMEDSFTHDKRIDYIVNEINKVLD